MENSPYIKDRAKYAQDLERYKLIVDYVLENPNETNANRDSLTCLRDELYKHIKEKSLLGDISNELYNKLNPFLIKNLEGKTDLLSLAKNLKQRIEDKLKSDIVSEIKNPNKERLK